MADRLALLTEANKRGLLTGQQKAAYDEAVRRGLIQADEPDALDESIAELSALEKAVIGAGRGFLNTARGLQQLAATIGAPGVQEAVNQRLQQVVENEDEAYQRLKESAPKTVGAGELIGEVASTPLPGPATGAKLGAKVIGGALAGGAASAAQYVPEGESRAKRAATGAAFGGGITGGLDVVSRTGRKIGRTGQIADDTAREVVETGQREGVAVLAPDVMQNRTVKVLDTASEPLGPLGTASSRRAQAVQARAAADRKLQKLAGDPVFDDLAEGLDDFADEVQSSMGRKLDAFKKTASGKYDRVARELDPLGDVPTSNFDKALKQSLAKAQARGSLADEAAIRKLEAFMDAPRGNYSVIRELRSDIGDEISAYYKGSSQVGNRGVGLFQSAKEALEKDLESFARSKGHGKIWHEADSYYRANVIPFKKGKLATLVASEEPETAWRWLVANGGYKSRSRRLYNTLDDRGKASVRYGLVKEAFDAASESAEKSGAAFSPKVFRNKMESRRAVIDQFFSGRDKEEIDGFIKLMKHIERAGQVAENPPTGQRVIPYLIFGGMTMDPTQGATAVLATGAAFTKFLFTTKTGRGLLLASGKASSESALENILQTGFNAASRAGALGQSENPQ